MNREAVDRIVAATLYEGYILYPYRPSSVKNQVRWTFGGVYPREYSGAVGGAEPWEAVTECLLRGSDDATVEVTVRFLHVVTRTAARLETPMADAPPDTAALRPVDAFELDGRIQRTWEEAAERRLEAGISSLGSLLAEPRALTLTVDAGEEVEWLRGEDGLVAGALLRTHQPLTVSVDISATRVRRDIAKLRVAITNVSPVSAADVADREAALRHALLSTHAVLGTENGAWLSLTDPPADAVEPAAGLRQHRPVADPGRCTWHRTTPSWPRRSSSRITRNWPPSPRASCSTPPRSTRSSPCASSPSPTRRRRRCAARTSGPGPSSTAPSR